MSDNDGGDRAGASRDGASGQNSDPREHLANERTLLAWVRTGISLISLGLLVERAGALGSGTSGGGSAGVYEVFGLALAAMGGVTLILGSVQFYRTRRMILERTFVPATSFYMALVGGSLVLAVAFIVYTLLR